MAKWKKLTEPNGNTIWVNVDIAMWVQRQGPSRTQIAFPGGEDDVVEVKEDVGEVIA